ncbi:MAG: potassium transporter KefB [Chitinophagaceae bacterium]|nr:potassium transporter KefB [Chitinophagaceae bacterium]
MNSHNTRKSLTPQNGGIIKRMLIGACIALLLISLFLYGVNNPKPEWSKLWILKPLLIVPIAGALGGFFYYMMEKFRNRGRWWNIIAIGASIIGYLIILWIGTILGLNGTLWD